MTFPGISSRKVVTMEFQLPLLFVWSKHRVSQKYKHVFVLQESGTQSNFHPENLALTTIDLVTAGTDTTATTIRWGLLFMSKYPVIQGRRPRSGWNLSSRDWNDRCNIYQRAWKKNCSSEWTITLICSQVIYIQGEKAGGQTSDFLLSMHVTSRHSF